MASRAELAALLSPGVLGPPGGLSCREKVLADSRLAVYIREIKDAEAALRGTPIPKLPLSLFRLFDQTGDRSLYEAPYFEIRRRLVAAGLAAWLWGGRERMASLGELILAVCDEYTWALPAHLEGATCPHREYLDLFACETAFALSEILALIGPSLAPGIEERAGREIESRVLVPFLGRPNP